MSLETSMRGYFHFEKQIKYWLTGLGSFLFCFSVLGVLLSRPLFSGLSCIFFPVSFFSFAAARKKQRLISSLSEIAGLNEDGFSTLRKTIIQSFSAEAPFRKKRIKTLAVPLISGVICSIFFSIIFKNSFICGIGLGVTASSIVFLILYILEDYNRNIVYHEMRKGVGRQ